MLGSVAWPSSLLYNPTSRRPGAAMSLAMGLLSTSRPATGSLARVGFVQVWLQAAPVGSHAGTPAQKAALCTRRWPMRRRAARPGFTSEHRGAAVCSLPRHDQRRLCTVQYCQIKQGTPHVASEPSTPLEIVLWAISGWSTAYSTPRDLPFGRGRAACYFL